MEIKLCTDLFLTGRDEKEAWTEYAEKRFDKVPGQRGEEWEQVAEEYAKGFAAFAELSRKFNKEISIENSRPALEKLKRELSMEDMIAVKRILQILEEEK